MGNQIITAAFQSILDNTKDMIFVKNANLVYEAASMPFVKTLGKESVDQVIGHTDVDIFEDGNLAKRYVMDDRKIMLGNKDFVDYIEPLPDDEGRHRYGSTSKYILRDESGEIIGLLGITRDITREYIARQHYQQELKYLFELPPDTYAVSYLDVDGWRIISQRKQLVDNRTIQSCNTVEELCDCALESIVDEQCEAAEFYRNFVPDKLRDIFSKGVSNLSFIYQREMSDGSKHWVQNYVRFLIDVDTGHLCAMLTAKDIDAEKKEEQRLVMAAKMDKMTMLLNRETTMDYIRQTLSKEYDKMHILYMLDVDNFKKLNDNYGHQIGDKFLIELAKEIKSNFRESDIVGRVGGDEFFALMKNVPDISMVSVKAKELLKVINRLCEKYTDIDISGSIGISIYPEDGQTMEKLYAKADEALYQAKRRGKNQFVFATR